MVSAKLLYDLGYFQEATAIFAGAGKKEGLGTALWGGKIESFVGDEFGDNELLDDFGNSV